MKVNSVMHPVVDTKQIVFINPETLRRQNTPTPRHCTKSKTDSLRSPPKIIREPPLHSGYHPRNFNLIICTFFYLGKVAALGKCSHLMFLYIIGQDVSWRPNDQRRNFIPRVLHRFLILITADLHSAPSRKSTQERSQPNLGQTMWS